MPSLSPARLGVVAVAGLALALLPAAAASSHVRVVPEQTAAGGWTVLTFRVPNESETAATSQVTVDLPTATPLLSVSTKPVPGWTASVETAPLPEPVDFYGTELTEAPSRVVWTAEPGAEIADGQFQEFEVSAGPLPDAGTRLVLPAHQTYTDGTVVDWDDVADEGADEPEHPAPVLTTTDGSGAQGVVVEAAAASDAASPGSSEPDTLARVLGGVGLALGVVALVVAVLGRRQRGDA
ncbi:YcnI family protein [Cellulomonas sp. Root137]|uniref:YcnI family copper-binding membrane protein n=1 Tax=Cellulomonas sp. Root137 TaxID=1736459 RepID=UPI0006F38E6A|nr:YcnI family protein [Cellulomonas sp. Root137]KQY46566.1 nuclear export factor GLE1 [Cellulomonas sp. Root137]